MALSALTAISPADGRYAARADRLRAYFSEFGLIRHRVEVEVRWLQALAAAPAVAELPAFSDSSGALANRFVVLPMSRSWYGKEDTGLTDRLLAELPGILNWAIRGWKRFKHRGRFEQPKSGSELLRQLDDMASPVASFLRERCETGPGRSRHVRC